MSAEDLANLICTKDTAVCASCMAFKYCKSEQNKSNCCEFIIEQWLNKEVNPMPEIEIGDIVAASSIYVALGDGLLVKPSVGMRVWVSDIKDEITTIQKFKDDHYEVVWRADNE
jgi:hypothetical protein